MNIIVFGWYNHDNIGDESYKLSFQSVWPNHKFTFGQVIHDDDENKYDLCIIGGGDVVRQRALRIVSTLKCPIITLSVTITNQSICSELKSVEHFYVRDEKSLQTLIDNGYTNATYIPDISIILEGDKVNGKQLISNLFLNNGLELYEKVYTVVINSHLLGDSQSKVRDKVIFDKMINDISELADSTNASFLFIPFSTRFPWDDRVTNGLANSFTKFSDKNCVIFNPLTITESIDIIAASDLLITSRFHGLIFGIGNQIPTITISFHDKISGFCETIKQNYLDYYNMDFKQFKNQIREVTINTNINRQKIKNDYIEKVYLLGK